MNSSNGENHVDILDEPILIHQNSNQKRKSLHLPTRSHFSTPSEDLGHHVNQYAISAQSVRQQTLSWTAKGMSSPLLCHSDGDALADDQEELLVLPQELKTPLQVSQLSCISEFNPHGVVEIETMPLLEDNLFVSRDNTESDPSFYADHPRQGPIFASQQMHWTHQCQGVIKTGFYSIPAVLLALLLNLLDAMSYGIILFPTSSNAIPETATQAGISMFLVSTFLSQLVYTLGGSAFKGAVGSMMIEIMPFLHIMVQTIEMKLLNHSPKEIFSTIMASYAMSCILTGLVFLFLGYYKLGNMIQFFPRHILVGCIGGIGLFLIFTGIEVTSGIKPALSFSIISCIFSLDKFKIWFSCIGVASALKAIQTFISHSLVVPLFYCCIPIVFYAITMSVGVSLEDLRSQGWLFNLGSQGQTRPFWEFWTFYDFTHVHWTALLATLPTQLALSFFGVLHVPINVPALSVSAKQEVDTNSEIIGHGLSNLCAGFLGVPQNYLVYSNSLLYIRSGGASRVAGLLLAFSTITLWICGGSLINYVPKILVGSLIFHLGFDLMKESLLDTLKAGVNSLEYLTILVIVLTMGFIGFTEGIFIGIILACVFFVVMYSRRSVIKSIYTASDLRSTVHRLYRQQIFLDKVGSQVSIIKLQGFIFFGTIHQLNEQIKNVIEKDSKRIRFLILDFSLIYGMDYSALESFQSIRTKLKEYRIHLVLDSIPITISNKLMSLFEEEQEDGHLHFFENLDQSLEWCENQLLSIYYTKAEKAALSIPNSSRCTGSNSQISSENNTLLHIVSPRRLETDLAASLILRSYPESITNHTVSHPVAVMMQAFVEQEDFDASYFEIVGNWFEKKVYKKGHILWVPGDHSIELFIVEQGELVLKRDSDTIETLLTGTMVGELGLFTNRPRSCTLTCHQDAILWRLSRNTFDKSSRAYPMIMIQFMKLALSFDVTRFYNATHHYNLI